MDNITPNSRRYKESLKNDNTPIAEKKLQPVVSAGKARTHKKSGVSKIAGSIISKDAQNVTSYIWLDVLIPSIKKAISDIVVNGIDIILYGETGRTKRNNAGRVSYRDYYDRPTDRFGSSRPDPRDRGEARTSRDSVSIFEDVVVDTRGEAEDILSRMSEYLEAYPTISIADMYDLANITKFPHTYNNYGWRSIVDAKPVRVSDGWLIKMPPVEPLK